VGTFAVDPRALEAAAGKLIAAGERVRSLAASLDVHADAAAATGEVVASSAYERMCAVWAAELLHLGESAVSTGQSTAWAGRLYMAVDEWVIPGGD
jgi:hypothetical protein